MEVWDSTLLQKFCLKPWESQIDNTELDEQIVWFRIQMFMCLKNQNSRQEYKINTQGLLIFLQLHPPPNELPTMSPHPLC